MKPKGRVILFTGEGKGKTTAALGMAVRACGHGHKVLLLQFIKSDSSTGEVAGFRNLPGAELRQTGLGFVPPETDPDFPRHCLAAEAGLEEAGRAVSSGGYDLVILDEVCLAVSRHLLREDEVASLVKKVGPGTCLVLTGRDATPGLMDLADTVTEMRLVRHGLTAGIKAQKGVEY
jgi:cob(I)alamin adenosyltransferase